MKLRYKVITLISFILLLGVLVPDAKIIPVEGAKQSDWNKDSFWYEPWGTSGVHKGIDIFAKKGVLVVAPANLFVLYKGTIKKGGNIVVGLGPKWRLHYFAHLASVDNTTSFYMAAGNKIGAVGDSGNAQGKQPHLHYAILSLIPLPWKMDGTTQGYKKAFYINPIEYLDY